MKVDGIPHRTIWPAADGSAVEIIDQTRLPHAFEILRLETAESAGHAIRSMQVRGAPLIGATGAYGMWLALLSNPSDANLATAAEALMESRPTAINLRWGVERIRSVALSLPESKRAAAALAEANAIAEDDVAACKAIGQHGLALFQQAKHRAPDRPVQVLTHCNAGWLATVDHGTALSPIYAAADAGISLHVWVDETRPRNQGASLTAWELGQHGVPHTVIADNAGGHLMQHGKVDLCITGTDRTTASGDVCNKIGTYLKALAAHDNSVPFYVALPHSTIDWSIHDGVKEIPIEERSALEVTHIAGRAESGEVVTVQVTPDGSPAANAAFDVTPARLVTGLITERGVCAANAKSLLGLYPERRSARE